MQSLLFSNHSTPMKNKHLLMLALCLALASCTCGQSAEKKAVKEVAYQYEYGMGNYNVDHAEKYATPETIKSTLDVARHMIKMVKPGYIESDTPAKIKIKSIKITSDTSATATWRKKTPIKDLTGQLELRKRNGQWYAHDMMMTVDEHKRHHHQQDKEQK